MRCRLLICIGTLVAAGACVVHAGEVPPASTPPWSIKKIARCEDAQPGAGDKTPDAPSSKYLHIQIALPSAPGDLKLHQFCIADEKGKTVAEVYGFHKGSSILVFEGDWSHLEGLYLEGARHREPLIPARPAQKPIVKTEPKPRPMPAPPEPPVVISRRPSAPAKSPKSAKLEGVEPAEPESPMVTSRRPSAPPKSAKLEGVEPAAEEKLYQEVLVTQRSRVNIQGLDFEGDLQYRVLSSLTLEKRNADGSRSVAQTVEQAEVIKADPLTQSIIRDLLGKLVGTTFQISVSPDGRVVDFRGATGRIRADAGNNPLGGQSFLMASIIDPDGWREIAELTFFRPPLPSEGRQSWDRPIQHSWGPLGSWNGKAVYSRTEQEGGLERFRYTFKLAYQSPKPGASGLPFQISRADFKHQEAGGTIAFDTAKGRVVQAEEHFPVKGSLTIELLGQESPVALEETQDFRIRVFRSAAVDRRTTTRDSKD